MWCQPKTLRKLSQKLTMTFINFKEGVSEWYFFAYLKIGVFGYLYRGL